MIKNQEGYTLLELLIVIGLMGGMMIFLMNIFSSIHTSYIRADQKAQNLEEARLIINHITDNFYSCDNYELTLVGGQNPKDLDADGFATVQEVKFAQIIVDPKYPNKVTTSTSKITYRVRQAADPAKERLAVGEVRWHKSTAVEVASQVSGFRAKIDPINDLLELKIQVIKEGQGLVADQLLEVRTSLNLKYMP